MGNTMRSLSLFSLSLLTNGLFGIGTGQKDPLEMPSEKQAVESKQGCFANGPGSFQVFGDSVLNGEGQKGALEDYPFACRCDSDQWDMWADTVLNDAYLPEELRRSDPNNTSTASGWNQDHLAHLTSLFNDEYQYTGTSTVQCSEAQQADAKFNTGGANTIAYCDPLAHLHTMLHYDSGVA